MPFYFPADLQQGYSEQHGPDAREENGERADSADELDVRFGPWETMGFFAFICAFQGRSDLQREFRYGTIKRADRRHFDGKRGISMRLIDAEPFDKTLLHVPDDVGDAFSFIRGVESVLDKIRASKTVEIPSKDAYKDISDRYLEKLRGSKRGSKQLTKP